MILTLSRIPALVKAPMVSFIIGMVVVSSAESANTFAPVAFIAYYKNPCVKHRHIVSYSIFERKYFRFWQNHLPSGTH